MVTPLRWLTELKEVLSALRELMQAQRHLFSAEWQLARSMVVATLLCGVLALFLVLALSLTTTTLAAILLEEWLGSWVLALAVLSGVLVFCLILVFFVLRYCLHRMSLPETRTQWRRTIKELTSTPVPRRSSEKR